MSCEQCLRELRIKPWLTRSPLQNPNEYITAPEDAMQIDLVPGLPPSGSFENIVTAMDVFSRYLFAYTTSNAVAKTIAKLINNIMTKHAYLPTTLLSDKGTAFLSHVIKEVAGVLGITLKHATTKHAQTIGLLERSHGSIKQPLKRETGDKRSLWYKYVSIASLLTTHLLTQVLAVNQVECFTDALLTITLIWNWVFVHKKFPLQANRLPKLCLNRSKWFSRLSPKMPCKPISNTKRIMTKRPRPQNLNKLTTFTYYSQKQIIKEAKFFLQIFGGLDPILLKRCYQTKINLYAKLAPIRRKYFIERGCVNWHLANPYRIHQSHHANGNRTRKVSWNMRIYTPEHGSVNMTSQYLIATTIIW